MGRLLRTLLLSRLRAGQWRRPHPIGYRAMPRIEMPSASTSIGTLQVSLLPSKNSPGGMISGVDPKRDE